MKDNKTDIKSVIADEHRSFLKSMFSINKSINNIIAYFIRQMIHSINSDDSNVCSIYYKSSGYAEILCVFMFVSPAGPRTW